MDMGKYLEQKEIYLFSTAFVPATPSKIAVRACQNRNKKHKTKKKRTKLLSIPFYPMCPNRNEDHKRNRN